MADAADVFAGIARRRGRALYRARAEPGRPRAGAAGGVDEIAIFAAASETFSQRNINQSIADSLADLSLPSAGKRSAAGLRVRAYLSTVFGCPFEGDVPVATVATVAAQLIDMGAYEVALSDTIGIAHPGQVAPVIDAVAPQRAVAADRAALPRHPRHGAGQRR